MNRSTFSLKFAQFLLLVAFMLLSWASAIEFSMCNIGEKKECEKLKAVFGKPHNLKCINAANIYRCMQMVKDGEVDVLGVSDTDLYAAAKMMDLEPFLREILDSGETYRYKAVFVIKKDSSIKDLKSLKDKKSCHTGAGKTTGWTVPVSNLQKLKIMDIKTCYDTVDNVANFFTESCVPGAMTQRFNPLYTNRPAVCTLCSDCLWNATFAGYEGALKCLLNGGGDIAFVSNKQLKNSDSLYLLCPDGSVKAETEYENCNWATRPSDVFVASPRVGKGKLPGIAKAIQDNAEHIKSHLNTFKDSNGFKETEEDFKTIMGDGFFNTFEYYHTCAKDLRWCTVSDAEMKKCADLKLAFAAKRATNKLVCVKGVDARDCIKKVSDKEADFVTVDGGIIVDAKNDKHCDITPGISENHLTEEDAKEASYYAVAVVKKNSAWTFPNLEGAKSCHTGYGKTSGWKVPVGLLISKDKIEKDDVIKNVGKYFSKSCVPGVLDKKNNPDGDNPSSLCELCPNKGKDCSANADNIYYGYTGAFRCLVENGGDVAFVKHTTVLESTDGKGKEDWEKDLKSEDYELLCADGSRESVKNWLKCHLAKVPAHAMVFKDKETIKRMYSVFSYMDLASSETKDLLFTSSGGKNLLFKDSAIGLSLISDPEKFIPHTYKDILEHLGSVSHNNICSAASAFSYSFALLLIAFITIFFKTNLF